MPLDIVHVFINGFYYDRVHGLMGSMNQEPMFDFNLPDGHVKRIIILKDQYLEPARGVIMP